MKNINFETWVIDSHDRLKKDHLGLEPLSFSTGLRVGGVEGERDSTESALEPKSWKSTVSDGYTPTATRYGLKKSSSRIKTKIFWLT